MCVYIYVQYTYPKCCRSSLHPKYCHQHQFSAGEIPFLYLFIVILCFVGCSVELKGYEEKNKHLQSWEPKGTPPNATPARNKANQWLMVPFPKAGYIFFGGWVCSGSHDPKEGVP